MPDRIYLTGIYPADEAFEKARTDLAALGHSKVSAVLPDESAKPGDAAAAEFAPLRLGQEAFLVVDTNSKASHIVLDQWLRQGSATVFRLRPNPRVGIPQAAEWKESEIWDKLNAIEESLEVWHANLTDALRLEHNLTAAAEWFLDNSYLIRTEIAEVRRHLPVHYRRQISKPGIKLRVFELARSMVARVDNAVNEKGIESFLKECQQEQPFTLAELWLFPLLLRVALIESLARLAEGVSLAQDLREAAYFWANRLAATARLGNDPLEQMLHLMDAKPYAGDPRFATALAEQLQEEEAALSAVLKWIEERSHTSVAELVREEHFREATERLSTINAFGSLKAISRIDYRDIFEAASVVEATLRTDPGGVYPRSDFTTRDRCRRVIERIALNANLEELEIARLCVRLAQAATDPRANHVAHYLLAAGVVQLEAEAHARVPARVRIARALRTHATSAYICGITMLTASLLAVSLMLAWDYGMRRVDALFVLGVLALFSLSELSIQIVNALIVSMLPPEPLPKLDFSQGIPLEDSTLVVVPMMLSSVAAIEAEVQKLEVRSLANRDAHLSFALLSDFLDAPTEVAPNDHILLAAARAGIERLQAQYSQVRFLLFHRPRVQSASERCWMGQERKRGKIAELNDFLCGDPSARGPLVGSLNGPIRFVITLDSDTQLPPGAARRLVETIAHPLNQVVLDPVTRVRRSGFAIIQPRVSIALPGANINRFTRIFAGASGTDPYTQTVSDAHQDLFGEALFHGKAIYDVAAFRAATGDRFPSETILSHDLIEGAHAGVGLASDVELFENLPLDYAGYIQREHRWIRGDWQIAPWILPRVPSASGQLVKNPLSIISRWRIADNLRRSLVAPAAILLLLLGWFVSAAPGVWSLVIAFTVVMPALAPLIDRMAHRVRGTVRRWQGAETELVRTVVMLAFLPHQAWVGIDAIVRASYRRLFSQRGLLEWKTADSTADSSERAGTRADPAFRQMLVIAVIAAGVLVAQYGQGRFAPATVFVALWMIAPLLLRYLGRPASAESASQLDAAERRYLRAAARRTWRYFDDLVNAESNGLPPDNSQLALHIEVAQRTSPTNIGLWLNGALAAVDLGYLTVDEFLRRSELTLETLNKLERYEGHLLNWYDTRTLAPLLPRYVSTVDSGNLLASLWVMRQSCEELPHEAFSTGACLRGLHDIFLILRETGGPELSSSEPMHALRRALRGRVEPHQILARLELVASALRQLTNSDRWRTAAAEHSYWISRLAREVELWIESFQTYTGWMRTLSEAPDSTIRPLGEKAVALRELCLRDGISLRALAFREAGQAKVPAVLQPLEELLALTSNAPNSELLLAWCQQVRQEYESAQKAAGLATKRIQALGEACEKLANGINMGFLYDQDRRLFGVGYALGDPLKFTSHYDLLASECRLASLVSIAKGDVPLEHWYALGRPRVAAPGHREALLSWGGTMFEFLMPLLFTRSYDNSLLDYGCQEAVREQMQYGDAREIPWGISESAFSALDANQIYQYRAFGVPSLALKAGQEDDLVVAPYATMLALMVDPQKAVENLLHLDRYQLSGPMGFYEAIDFRFQANPNGDAGVPIYAYMAHHQGMSLLAMDNVLHHGVMQQRFHRIVRIRAIESLLFERIPITPPGAEPNAAPLPARHGASVEPSQRSWQEDTAVLHSHLYGNGKYALMLTNSGGGYSRWKDFDVSRWRADSTLDDLGTFFFLRDLKSNQLWCASRRPMGESASGTVRFSADRAEFERKVNGIETLMSVTVATADDVEVRRLTIVNQSPRPRSLEVTSYLELAMAPHRADTAHPAFAKLFVETEKAEDVLIARRRLRAPEEEPIWMGHHVMGLEPAVPLQFETDRRRFLGRGRTLDQAEAHRRDLSGTTGTVLDPIFSLRAHIALEPRSRIELTFLTVAAPSREKVLEVIARYRSADLPARAFEMAWMRAQLELRYLGVGPAAAHRFQELATYVLFPHSRMRSAEERLRLNNLGQAALWAQSISGDLPIVAVTVGDPRQLPFLREILLAHTYWRLRGLQADLVVLNLEGAGYDRPLFHQMSRQIEAHSTETGVERPGGVFLRDWFTMPEEQRNLILASASVVLHGWRGPLQRQLPPYNVDPLKPAPPENIWRREEPSAPLPFLELPYFNGTGGFTQDGREYAIYLGPGVTTPAPWANVMAHANFGTLVTESGLGCTWSGNSQTNRLTPWTNDPVRDQAREIIYLRDELSGALWTPTPLPIRETDPYRARHGQGYSVYEHNSHAIEQELTVFVPLAEGQADDPAGDPVKISRLRLKNASHETRRITVTYYAEWVLGGTREDQQLHIRTSHDDASGALLASQTWTGAYTSEVAFIALSPRAQGYSGDRTQFLGRNGTYEKPRALRTGPLDMHVGTGLDPAGVLQITLTLEPGRSEDVVCLLGQAKNVEEVQRLVARYSSADAVERALQATRNWWDLTLGALVIETPTLSTDFLVNRWLLYQTLSCRFFGRTAFYQSSGAFGFRDQLQDCLALVYSRPALARQHILTTAARQFVEGDVQHWWHPETGLGVRSRCSDDLVWLPYAVAQYVRVTADARILDEEISFLEAPELSDGEAERMFVPDRSRQTAPLWRHCVDALERAWKLGMHRLPLMGGGDWNDGMNRVGREGKGESVWLGWFLCAVADSFASAMNDHPGAEAMQSFESRVADLKIALEQSGWDGAWYLRGFFDDGSPLGSEANAEAQLDSIAQSWAVLSGAADPLRAHQAMASAVERCQDTSNRLLRLLIPPFDHSTPHPGYIMGYPPGVRENGGQYTHGSVWIPAACALLGDGDTAVRLLELMSPIESSRDPVGAARYSGEPYVTAGDVYAAPGHMGQSGWTWYTGSSGWMYRVWIEYVLGFELRGNRLTMKPAIPEKWPGFKIRYRYHTATYDIAVTRGREAALFLDGKIQPGGAVLLEDDGKRHQIVVSLGASPAARDQADFSTTSAHA